jgi:hypothetical protein
MPFSLIVTSIHKVHCNLWHDQILNGSHDIWYCHEKKLTAIYYSPFDTERTHLESSLVLAQRSALNHARLYVMLEHLSWQICSCFFFFKCTLKRDCTSAIFHDQCSNALQPDCTSISHVTMVILLYMNYQCRPIFQVHTMYIWQPQKIYIKLCINASIMTFDIGMRRN